MGQLLRYGAAILLGLLAIGGGIYWAVSWYLDSGELGTKKYYAVLQGVEFDNRKGVADGPLLKDDVDGSGLSAMGIPSRGSVYPRVWIALNLVGPNDKVLAVPEGVPLNIRCEEVQRAIGGKQVAEPVRRYLSKECTKG
jgi:hypothetical protein